MKIDNSVLKQLEIIYNKYSFLKSKEEKFNIFSVLYKNHEEVKLHSRFIAALLDPHASHEKGFAFLKEFINIFSDNILKFDDFENAIVYPEEWNKKENHNIDILIIDRKRKNAIILENKLNADDSNNENGGQLERYFKYVRDEEKIPIENITTFYLTLDGHKPTDESLGKKIDGKPNEFNNLEDLNGHCITYNNKIIKWLDKCLMQVADKPFIRESIIQYKNLIKKITMNDIDINERLEIIEAIAKDETSMNSTKYLIDNFIHVKWHTVADFWNELTVKLEKELNFEIIEKPNEQNITDITHFEIYRTGQKAKQDCGIVFKINDSLTMSIWNEADEWLFFSFNDNDNRISDKNKKIIEQLREDNILNSNNNKGYFWKLFFENDEERIWLSNFSHQGTFDLINKKKRTETTNKIIGELSDFLRKYFKLSI